MNAPSAGINNRTRRPHAKVDGPPEALETGAKVKLISVVR